MVSITDRIYICWLSAAEFIYDHVTELLGSFLCQLEMKQRYLVGKMTVSDEKEGGSDEVTMETLGEEDSS